MCKPGDRYVKVWDAAAYVDVVAFPETDWSTSYMQLKLSDSFLSEFEHFESRLFAISYTVT